MNLFSFPLDGFLLLYTTHLIGRQESSLCFGYLSPDWKPPSLSCNTNKLCGVDALCRQGLVKEEGELVGQPFCALFSALQGKNTQAMLPAAAAGL